MTARSRVTLSGTMLESSGTIGTSAGPSGFTVSDNSRKVRWFRITGGSNPYAAQEIYMPERSVGSDTAGVTADDTGGYTITEDQAVLWSLDADTGIAAGTVVRADPNDDGLGFVFGGSGANTRGVDAAGFTDYCTVTDIDGFVTGISRRVKYGRMFRCEPIDECCLSAWWCISNEQVELTLACCTPATITRVIRLALTSKTGDCADLPDLVHLVHTGGTDLTWTTGGLEYWGSRQYSATLTLSCSGANLKADLTISDFTGGTSTTIPCDLTSTGVALGTFTYSGAESDGCGGETALSGTVAIAVSSWEDGSGVAIEGAIEFGEDEVPPWDATGPYKTEADAEVCCVPGWYCVDGEVVKVRPITGPAPAGTVVDGPYETEDEALEACPFTIACGGHDIPLPRLMSLEVDNVVALGATTGMPFDDYGLGTLDLSVPIRRAAGPASQLFPSKAGNETLCGGVGNRNVPIPRDVAATGSDCHQIYLEITCAVGSGGYEVVDWSASVPGDSGSYLIFELRYIPQGTPNPLGQLDDVGSIKRWAKRVPTVYSAPDSTGLDTTMGFGNSSLTATWNARIRVEW